MLNLKDVEFVAFRKGRGPGGQNKNKQATSVRATHIPTGIRAESSKERTLGANKKAVVKILEDKLEKFKQDKVEENKQRSYHSKEDPAFGSQIRTYRITGNAPGVLDHRTGIFDSNVQNILDGKIDAFIMGNLREKHD